MQQPLARLLMTGLLASLIVLQGGCQDKSTNTSDAILIELSEPEAVLVEKEVLVQVQPKGQKNRIRVLQWQVKYRFLRGEPDPDAPYACILTIDNGKGTISPPFLGKELKAHGVFKKELLYQGKGLPRSLKIIACQYDGPVLNGFPQGAAHQISKAVACPIKQ